MSEPRAEYGPQYDKSYGDSERPVDVRNQQLRDAQAKLKADEQRIARTIEAPTKAESTAAYREGFMDGLHTGKQQAQYLPSASGSITADVPRIGESCSLPPTVWDVAGECLVIVRECADVLSKLETTDTACVGAEYPPLPGSLQGRVEALDNDLRGLRDHLKQIADRLGRV